MNGLEVAFHTSFLICPSLNHLRRACNSLHWFLGPPQTYCVWSRTGLCRQVPHVKLGALFARWLTVQIYRSNLKGPLRDSSSPKLGSGVQGTGNTFIGPGTEIADSFPVRLENSLDLGNYHSSLMGWNNPSEILRPVMKNVSLLLFLFLLITRHSSRSCPNRY